MFADIAELEKEIELFKQNMSSSKELNELLGSVATLINQQADALSTHETEMKEMKSQICEEIREEIAQTTGKMVTSITDEQRKYSDSTKRAFSDFTVRIEECEEHIREMVEKNRLIEEKYLSILNTAAEINRNLKIKLAIIMGGVGISIALGIIGAIL